MYQLLYSSSAVQAFTSADLKNLLKKSRSNNEASDITGMLLYKDGHFMQVLEGTELAISNLYDRISEDPRHTDLTLILLDQAPERQFFDWTMAFFDLDKVGSQEIPGYSEFMGCSLVGPEFTKNPSRCQEFLLIFKEYSCTPTFRKRFWLFDLLRSLWHSRAK